MAAARLSERCGPHTAKTPPCRPIERAARVTSVADSEGERTALNDVGAGVTEKEGRGRGERSLPTRRSEESRPEMGALCERSCFWSEERVS